MKDFQSIPKSQVFTREQLKAIRGGDGYYDGGLGPCTETCTNGGSTTSCSSSTGDCSKDIQHSTITCDGKSYDC